MHPGVFEPAPAAARGGMSAASGALLEREGELGRMRALIDGLVAGGAGVVLVEGPAGIGKTQLLLAANEMAEGRSARVLLARASELERDFPFGVARQWFEPIFFSASERERAGLMDGAAALAAPALAVNPAERSNVSIAVLHGLYWLIANLARAGALLLALDDAQWADAGSLRLLNHLVPRIEGLAVGVLVAYREPEPDEGGTLLARLGSDPSAELVRPGVLSDEAVGALISSVTGQLAEQAFVRAARAVTGGNPFYVRELARALVTDRITPTAAHVDWISNVKSQTLSRAILGRLRPQARALAQALAVLEGPAEPALAAELAGDCEGAAAQAADELARAGVIADARPLVFAHSIVRAAILSSLSSGQRAALHARAAELLIARGAPADRIAVHLQVSEPGGDERAVETLLQAGQLASTRGDPDAAVRILRRALQEPPSDRQRVRVLVALARAELQAETDLEDAATCLREAYGLAADPVQRAEILRDLGWVMRPVPLAMGELAPLLERAIEGVVDRDRELALALEATLISGLMLSPHGLDEMGRRLDRLGDLEGSSPSECVLLAQRARYLMSSGHPAAEAAAAAERAAAHPPTLEREGPDSQWLLNTAITLIQTDRLDAAERLLEQALERSRQQGSAPGFVLACVHRSRVARRRGDLGEAEAEARAAIAGGAAKGWYTYGATFTLIEALIEQGRLDDAQAAYEHYGPGEQIPDVRPATPLLISRGWLRKQQGRLDAALADLHEARRRLAGYNAPLAIPGLDARVRAILVHHALGDTDTAHAEAQQALRIARHWGTPATIGETLRVCGLIQRGPAGLRLLQEASHTLADSPARLEHARALIDLGAALRRAGKRAAAREPLRTGFRQAERSGATQLAERARKELAASGIRVRRHRGDQLTPSERRIAEIAATGATNPQIAQSLFITIKTVEGHLTNAYRKLNINSRQQLTSALRTPQPQTTTPGRPTAPRQHSSRPDASPFESESQRRDDAGAGPRP
jgi:DNA-binding CsgD family transcriptional regulator